LNNRAAWKSLAQREERGLYLRFCNMMINDCIHLLDESLKALPDIREAESLVEDPARWGALTPQERQERQALLAQQTRTVRSDLELAHVIIKMIEFSTEDNTVRSAQKEKIEP
jgi:hypothetical protein